MVCVGLTFCGLVFDVQMNAVAATVAFFIVGISFSDTWRELWSGKMRTTLI